MKAVFGVILMCMTMVANASLVDLEFSNGSMASFDTNDLPGSLILDGIDGNISISNSELVLDGIEFNGSIPTGSHISTDWTDPSISLVDGLTALVGITDVFTSLTFNSGGLNFTPITLASINVTSVPVPPSIGLMLMALAGLSVTSKRSKPLVTSVV